MVETPQRRPSEAGAVKQHANQLRLQLLIEYGYMALWVFLSALVILVNKYVLSYAGFPYPVALTCIHMVFCSTLANLIVKMGWAEANPIDKDVYITCILPIGFLFAVVLWTGNAAYLYLSVSFIQMIKAAMPMVVFLVGVLFTTERFTFITGINMLVVGVGTAIASHGEMMYNHTGMMFQVTSIAAEGVRLTLIQILLQRKGIKMNPISTLYHIAPCCLLFLTLPFCFKELPQMARDPNLVFSWHMILLLLASAVSAFALNMAVFLLIGKTSALTMNVTGVVKDWLLIGLSVALYGSLVTQTQLLGYSLAFLGVMFFNWNKLQQMSQTSGKAAEKASDLEKPHQLSPSGHRP